MGNALSLINVSVCDLFLTQQEEVTLTLKKDLMEVVKTECMELDRVREPEIYGVKITLDAGGCYCISVRHAGHFRLKDYEELDLEVKSARLVQKSEDTSRVY